MATFLICTVLSVGIGAGVGWMRHRSWAFAPALILFGAAMIAILGFWAVPWVKFAGSAEIDAHAAWIADHSQFLESVRDVPGMSEMLHDLHAFTPGQVLEWFSESPLDSYLVAAQAGRTLTGSDLLRLSWKLHGTLPAAMGIALLVSILGAVVGAVSVLGAKFGRAAHGVLLASAAIALLLFMGQVTVLDTLGEESDFKLRLLSIVTGATVTAGHWSMILGLAGIALSCLLMFVAQPAPQFQEDDFDPELSTGF
jgi:hypothetical protein